MAMAEERSRLGRGLAALIGDVGDESAAIDRARGQKRVPIEFLRANPKNPRKQFDEEELENLSSSIREKGILQPILVRPVAGRKGAAVDLNDGLADSQPQPDTGNGGLFMAAGEFGEDLLFLPARDPRPAIPHIQQQMTVFAGGGDADFRLTSRIFHRVFQQIYQHPLKQRAIQVYQH